MIVISAKGFLIDDGLQFLIQSKKFIKLIAFVRILNSMEMFFQLRHRFLFSTIKSILWQDHLTAQPQHRKKEGNRSLQQKHLAGEQNVLLVWDRVLITMATLTKNIFRRKVQDCLTSGEGIHLSQEWIWTRRVTPMKNIFKRKAQELWEEGEASRVWNFQFSIFNFRFSKLNTQYSIFNFKCRTALGVGLWILEIEYWILNIEYSSV